MINIDFGTLEASSIGNGRYFFLSASTVVDLAIAIETLIYHGRNGDMC